MHTYRRPATAAAEGDAGGCRSGWLRWEKKWTKCWQRRRRWARRFNRLLETTGSRGLSGQRLDLKQAKIILMMSSSAQRNEVDQRGRRGRSRRMKGHNWSAAAATKEEKRNHFLTITGCAARPASANPTNQSVQFGSALSSLSCSSLSFN